MESSSLLFGAAMVAVLGIGVVALVVKARLDKARRQAYAAFAAAHGLTYTPRGPDRLFEALREAKPFGRGHSRSADDVLVGRWRDRAACGFTYTYKVTTSNGKTSTTRVYHWQVATLQLSRALPALEVHDEGLFGGRVAATFGFVDIELESDAFNRRFRLTAEDARYASAFVHPRVMELMLARQSGIFRVDGALLVQLIEQRPTPADLAASWDYLSQLADLVPGFVLDDYGQPR
jgi:hypothetical protein